MKAALPPSEATPTAVFGDPGPFFQYQSFALGGVQFGQPLRGYPEFSITPLAPATTV